MAAGSGDNAAQAVLQTAERLRELSRQGADALAQVIEYLPVGVFVGDLSGIGVCNRVGLEMLGFASPEEMRRHVDALAERLQARRLDTGEPIVPDNHPFVLALRGQPAAAEILYRHVATGREAVMHCTAVPVVEEGKVTRAIAVTTDVTDRVRAEEALRVADERFAKAFQLSPDAIILSRLADGLILQVNDAWETLFEYRPDEVVGRSSLEIGLYAHKEDRQEAVRLLQERGNVRNFELGIHRKSGEYRHAALSAQKIVVGGEPCLLTFLRDITESKRAEQALRESEERFRIAAETTSDLLFEWQIATDAIRWHGSAEHAFFGYSLDELPTKRSEWGRFLHPDDRQRAAASINRAVADGTGRFAQEYRVVGRGGSVYHVASQSSILRDRKGNPVRVIGAITDITERKRAELERTAILEENTRLLQARTEAAAQQRAFLRDVLFSVTEGKLHLCDDRADLPEPLPPATEPIPLSKPVLIDVRHRVQEVAVSHGLAPERGHDLVSAVGECAMNAVQHGGDVATARVCAAAGRVQVWVEDRGKGIDVSDLPRATLLKGHSGGASFGHGFFMMLQTVDAIYLLTGPQGTTVVLEQADSPPEPLWMKIAMEGWDL